MTKKNIFLILAIIGFIVPYYFFLRLPAENGFNLPSLVQPFFANSFMKGAAMDLTISVIVFWTYAFMEARKLQMKNAWVYALATLLVGLSFALPLFLYFRERKIETRHASSSAAGLTSW
jgi:hypothetical protein